MNTLKSRPEVLRDLDLHNLWHPFTQHQVWCEEEPLIIERGEGFRLVDIDGRSYLDGVSSLWCNVHGHGDPDLLLALHEQVDMLCHSTLLGLSHRPILELTKRLLKVVPKNLSRAFYSDSGSAAVEAALRMSVEWWQKKPASISARKKHKIVSLASGYHGDTLGAVGLGYLPEFHEHLQPLLVPSIKINPPHVYRLIGGLTAEDALQKSLDEAEQLLHSRSSEIAAFFIEPLVQGAAGIWTQPEEFCREISRLCHKYDVLLIADEVATGFGKTGAMFAVERIGVAPDILTIGKGLSAGYLPISAAIVSEEIFQGFLGAPEEMKTFFFGQTFSGNPLAARVSETNLKIFAERNLIERLAKDLPFYHTLLAEKLSPLAHVLEVRAQGIMTGVELTSSPGKFVPYDMRERVGLRIVKEARERGVILRPLGNVLVLMPAVAMGRDDMEELVSVSAQAIRAVTEA